MCIHYVFLLQENKSYISNEWVAYKDGRIYCQFYLAQTSKVKGMSFNLKSNAKYHFMLATGKTGDGGEALN